jgi:hypothetical protein
MLGAVAPVVRLSIVAAVVPAVAVLIVVAAAVVTAGVNSKPGSRAVAAADVALKHAAGEALLSVGASLLQPCIVYF